MLRELMRLERIGAQRFPFEGETAPGVVIPRDDRNRCERLGFLLLCLLEIDGEQGDVRWGDATNPSGLSKSGGPDLSEFLARLGAETPDRFVVEPIGNTLRFHAFGSGDRVFLAFDITFVFKIG